MFLITHMDISGQRCWEAGLSYSSLFLHLSVTASSGNGAWPCLMNGIMNSGQYASCVVQDTGQRWTSMLDHCMLFDWEPVIVTPSWNDDEIKSYSQGTFSLCFLKTGRDALHHLDHENLTIWTANPWNLLQSWMSLYKLTKLNLMKHLVSPT